MKWKVILSMLFDKNETDTRRPDGFDFVFHFTLFIICLAIIDISFSSPPFSIANR